MKKIIYSLIATLMMACAMESVAQTVSGKKGGHDYVDLGLPSGRLWATCNVGASKPTEYGDYFAWGETRLKNEYSWDMYKWTGDDGESITKYTTDGCTVLTSSDDAATANWGSPWCMPTHEEQKELLEGCTWTWISNFKGSGIAGRIGKSKKNGNTIFLPAAGYRLGTDLYDAGGDGDYRSSSLCEDYSFGASSLYFNSDYIYCNSDRRYDGRSVRAVVR